MNFGRLLHRCFPLLFLAFIAGCTGNSPVPAPTATAETKAAKPILPEIKTKEQMAEVEDIPLYPGAEFSENDSKITPGAVESRYDVVLVTKDPAQKVIAFYQSKIPHLDLAKEKVVYDLIGPTPKGALAHITITEAAGKTTIKATAVVENPPAPK